jgi:ABC-type sugar transport system ATPase subunit
MNELFLETRGISKRFPGTVALDGVSLSVYAGEVLGVIGENGAGKSTLMNIISGVFADYDGEIFVNGVRAEIRHPLDSKRLGIVTIHQELSLFSNLDIGHNIFAGNERRRHGVFLDATAMYGKAKELTGRLGLTLNPHTLVKDLTVAQKQMVEIARALSYDARLIIMDEPTSSLSAPEIDILGGIIDSLKKSGVSVIFITHKLNEIERFTDRVCVLRDGRNVDVLTRDQYSYERFIQGMVGRGLADFYRREERTAGEVVLDVKGLSTGFLKEISFSVRRGEVLGLAGSVGSGRTEIMEALFGIDPVERGVIMLEGRQVAVSSPSQALKQGIALVPEDRKLSGLVLHLPVKQNIILSILSRISSLGFIRSRERTSIAEDSVHAFTIKVSSIDQQTGSLSGGNQQKVVLSKWLATKPRVLFLDEPTRGIDVNAKQEIYAIINSLAREGYAIVLSSSELEEIIKMSDRIIVLYEGRIKGELDARTASEESILATAHR